MKKSIKKIYHSLGNKIYDFCREIKLRKKRNKLHNKDVTIICSDCIGGVIYHELKLKFNSPTINLYICPSDFIKFCLNLDFYLNSELKKYNNKDNKIIGKLADIKIHFIHYKTFDDAKTKWEERKKRIDKKNMCIILTCKDGYTENDIKNFKKIKTKSKVVFVPQKYLKYSDSFFIKKSEKNNEVAFLGTKINHFGKKLIDDFDIVSFINNIGEKNGKSKCNSTSI